MCECFMTPRYHFHQQISDLKHPKCYFRLARNRACWCLCDRLWFAPCALKRNGTFARSWSFFFSSSPCESVLIRGKTTMFAQFKFASHFEDNSGVHVFCRGHCHLVDKYMNQHQHHWIRPLWDKCDTFKTVFKHDYRVRHSPVCDPHLVEVLLVEKLYKTH